MAHSHYNVVIWGGEVTEKRFLLHIFIQKPSSFYLVLSVTSVNVTFKFSVDGKRRWRNNTLPKYLSPGIIYCTSTHVLWQELITLLNLMQRMKLKLSQ